MIRRRLISVCVVALFGILLMGQESWPPSTGCTEGADCDGSDLGGESCETLGYPGGGDLSCTGLCVFNTTQCVTSLCGNGLINAGEDCDGSDLSGESCETLGYDGGTLSCSDKCEYSTTQCSHDPIEFPPTPRGVLRSTGDR
jgi:hypothetical protein